MEDLRAWPDAVVREMFGFPSSSESLDDLSIAVVEPPSPYTLAGLILLLSRLYKRSFVHRFTHRNGCPCLFIPTCREFLERAVVKYGPWRGLWLAWKRLRRCNGLHRGPYVDFP